MAMDRLLQLMADKKASDLYLSAGSPINIKIAGSTVPINQQVMDPESISALLAEILPEARMLELEQRRELNVGIPIRGLGSFRLSAFRQRGSYAAVIRFIPFEIPALETLNVPLVLGELIMEKRGLILMVGATGSGKTTSLASMIDYRNEKVAGHILTLEDPIEFLFKSKKSVVNQREIGSDAESLQTALKNALRQAPDLIMIGEIRDRETMAAALAYGQAGHLVLATLHANNAYHALNRVISFYPIDARNALLADMATCVRAIVSQRLLKAKAGGRVPACEVLLNTRYIADLIEHGKVHEIPDAMQNSLAQGSITFEQSLYKLIHDELVTMDEALANADSATNLSWLINNQGQLPGVAAKPDVPEEISSGPSFKEFTLEV
ncbi:PilT/PilU family type 4a pilus ATPase [Derxia gummosa]|uniref:PilT/PilU family type 4a pilus ATPase n=1 Tax=Derxia gummosa DSM 723 TaxID=1121388 RepID=A0A8B6X3R2_9BURK|nr:PilT/PilU family type 4a pilus ATPase [Derxia gummosa]